VNRANDTIWIELLPAIKADLGDDRLVCENEPEFLIKPTCFDCQFQWNTGDLTDSISISEAGIYWLEIISANGCQSIDSVEIDFGKCSCDLYLPNAFSPNNDGLNDTFSPKFECDIVDYSMLIFNRWGELIYSSTNSLDSWNGKYNNKRVAVDIYSYRLTYTSAFLDVNQSPIIELGLISIVN
jgi:gliding motility-associated-like protein